MRDIIWLIPDLQCKATILGFIQRNGFHHNLGCGPFRFSEQEDLLVHPGHDPGVWKYSQVLLASKKDTHERSIIILDNDWDGSPGVAQIEADIEQNMIASGWAQNRFEVIVIDPELESWIWQDNIHVEEAFDHARPPSLRDKLATLTLLPNGKLANAQPALGQIPIWPVGDAKPPDPKSAVEAVTSMKSLGPVSAVFNEIASKVGVGNCQDPAFQKLRATLQQWFPPQAQ